MNAKAQLAAINRNRHLHPKCGAKARSTGEPCRQLAMANGRCRWHGGAVGRGKAWGLPVWPDGKAPGAMDKANRKLRDLQRAARKREKRVAAMSQQERADYEKWKRAHKPGAAADRARARADRAAAAEIREMLAREPAAGPSPEASDLKRAREFLSRQSEAIARREAAQDPNRDDDPTHAFKGAFS